MGFLRDNWLWLLLPFVVLAVLVLIAFFVTADSVTPFSYALD